MVRPWYLVPLPYLCIIYFKIILKQNHSYAIKEILIIFSKKKYFLFSIYKSTALRKNGGSKSKTTFSHHFLRSKIVTDFTSFIDCWSIIKNTSCLENIFCFEKVCQTILLLVTINRTFSHSFRRMILCFWLANVAASTLKPGESMKADL